MTLKIKTIARKNLQNAAEPAKFYALAESSGKTDIDQLSKIIANNSTVSRTDVYAVIIGLLEAINNELSAGRSIYLGKLGSFSVNVRSAGELTADAVTAASIKSSRVIYRPGPEIKDMLKTMKYEKKA